MYTAAVPYEWTVTTQAYRVDVGVVVARRRPADGARLGDVVSTLGFAANVSDKQMYHAFGYPAATQSVWPYTAFNGQRMWSCQAPMARRVTEAPGTTGPAPMAIGCDMTGGSSGGAWGMGFNDGYSMGWHVNGGWVNGVTSYRMNSEPRAIHGPYHGDLAIGLWEFVRTMSVPWP